jgi:hypothetical protein
LAEGPTIRPVTASKHVKIFLFGVSGIGKTQLLGSLCKVMVNGRPAKVLLIRPPTDSTAPLVRLGYDVSEIIVHNWEDMFETEDYLRIHGKEWDFVCFDSITLWEEIGLDDVWEAAKARPGGEHRAKFGRDKQEYGITMQRMDEWLRHVVGMDTFNFVMAALPMQVSDPETGEMLWYPSVQGRDGSKRVHMICGYFNVVAYYGITRDSNGKVKQRTLHLAQDGEHYAKDQYDSQPKGRLVNPDMPTLMAGIDKARGSKPTRTATKRSTTKRPARRTRRES